MTNMEMCTTTIPPEVINSKDLAIFQSVYIWNLNQTLTVAFLNDGSQTPYKSAADFPGAKLDPLQYKFDEQYKLKTFDMKKAVQEIVEQRINPLINAHLRFHFIDDPKIATIKIQFNSLGGSSSLVGTQAKTVTKSDLPTMQFAWFDVGTVLHEFGHALGLVHEHENPNGNPIQWNPEALYKWAAQYGWDQNKVDTQIIKRYNSNEINGSQYDPQSVMLYFYPASVTLNGKGTSQNLVLSEGDKQVIRDQYGESYSAQRPPIQLSSLATGAIVMVCAVVAIVVALIYYNRKKKS